MKQTIFILLLAIAAFTLAACSLRPDNNQQRSGDNVPAGQINAPHILTDGQYTVDPANSKIAWRAAKISGQHTGLVALKSGELTVENGQISNGSFIINMASISSDENLTALVNHLNSADFFDVVNYPEAKLRLDSAQYDASSGTYNLSGELTIKDTSAPVQFTANISGANDSLSAQADINLDRTRWNIKYLSGNFFKDLGDKAIEDIINFQISLQAKR